MIALLLFLGMALGGCARAPTFLHTFGYRGDHEASLGRVLLIIAAAVVVAVGALVLAAIYRRRGAGTEVMRGGGGLPWIVVGGVIVPSIILVGVLFLAMSTLAADATPPTKPAFTIQVTGHRWWWEVRYPGDSPGDLVITANEIHIPAGRPVRLELTTADVIHSFWIPQLAGKTDLIPGQRNVTWIEADSAGTYWGHCGEYCGLQHANMLLFVTAEPADRFSRWLEGQRRPAAEPAADSARMGHDVFLRSACALCHTVRGTEAGGILGPDLTHLASRKTLAAGMMPNTRGNLLGWIAHPHGIKPGVVMPAVPLPPRDLVALVTYLQTLR
jgi:cytochrome c oxidase subunit 2